MDNGGFFLLGLFGFFFLLWILGGGPRQQIAHQGVFITPVTSPESEQRGYGPKPDVNLTIPLPAEGNVTIKSPNETKTTSTPQVPSLSVARSSQTSAANPNQRYVEFTITSHTTTEVNIKGWKFISTSSKGIVTILADTVIKPGQTILVVTSFPTTNTHDTMQLVNTSGSVVATVAY